MSAKCKSKKEAIFLDKSKIDNSLKEKGGQMMQCGKILVIEDDPNILLLVRDTLESSQFVVTSEQTAKGGLDTISKCPPDVLVLDINLPDMSGYDLLLKLKTIIDPTPLVLMKGFGYDPGHAMVKARQAGLHPKAVLYKPFRLDQLLDVCKTIVEAYDNSVSQS